MPQHQSRRIVVLIDAENVPATTIGRVFDELARFGEPVVRRAYGDFSGPLGAGWEEVFTRHAIMPQHQASYGKGKNAADIALVIDAMDLLHGGEYDAFCIVSTDSDFARLAIRIREQKLDCYVFGSQKTPERLRSACTRFVYLENLKFDPLRAAMNLNMKPLRPKSDALPIVRAAIADLANTPGDWVEIDVLERELGRRTSDFDPRTYGYVRLRDLLVALKRPVIVHQSRGVAPRVRLRMKKANQKAVTERVANSEADRIKADDGPRGPGEVMGSTEREVTTSSTPDSSSSADEEMSDLSTDFDRVI